MSNKPHKVETGTMLELGCEIPRSDEEIRNELLILSHQLSAVQISIYDKVEEIYNRQGLFKYKIKHEHRQVRELLRKGFPNWFGNEAPKDPVERKKYFDNLEAYANDVEELTKAILKVKHLDIEL